MVRTLIVLVGSAVGLLVAATVLDGVDLDVTSFILDVVIFTIVFALMQPFLGVQLRRGGSGLLGGVALIATFVALLITDLISDGLTIDGLSTWIAATVIVWLGSVIAVFVLPYLGLKKYLDEKKN
jgi:uncharacterized membrane protein YvlD (DUF360 family)